MVGTAGSVDCRRPETESATLLKSGVQSIRIFLGKVAVFLRPRSEKLLQLMHSSATVVRGLGTDLLSEWFDTHGLAFFQ